VGCACRYSGAGSQSTHQGRAHAEIAAIVKDSGWTQTEAASRCGVTQPRMNDLLRGRVSRFSLDALVNIATAMGYRVHIELDAA
jgi:predicted XRE-type DNA-binding protein